METQDYHCTLSRVFKGINVVAAPVADRLLELPKERRNGTGASLETFPGEELRRTCHDLCLGGEEERVR